MKFPVISATKRGFAFDSGASKISVVAGMPCSIRFAANGQLMWNFVAKSVGKLLKSG